MGELGSFEVILGTIFFRLPAVIAPAAAILAKFANPADQAFVQSIRTIGERLAMICSQNWFANWVWAISTLHNAFYMLGFVILFLSIDLIFIIVGWAYLKFEVIRVGGLYQGSSVRATS